MFWIGRNVLSQDISTIQHMAIDPLQVSYCTEDLNFELDLV